MSKFQCHDSPVIEWVQITNNSGSVRANLLSYGATLVSLFYPDKDGRVVDLVLGYDTIEGESGFMQTFISLGTPGREIVDRCYRSFEFRA